MDTLFSLINRAGIEMFAGSEGTSGGSSAREGRGPLGDFWYNPVTGNMIGPREVMAIGTAYACIDRYQSTFASLPCVVYEKIGPNRQREATNHPAYYVVHDVANDQQTASEMFSTALIHILGWGNFIARQVLSPRKDVIALETLEPWRTRIEKKERGVKTFTYTREDGSKEILFDGDVLHIPGAGFDGVKGYTPVELLQRTFCGVAATEEYTRNFMANSGIPPAYISIPGKATDATMATFHRFLMSQFNVEKAGRLGVIDQGAKVETVSMKHSDLQFIELRKFQREEMCAVYNMPPSRVQNMERSTYSNAEQEDRNYAKHTILPLCVRIEKRLNWSLFGPREGGRFYCQFDLDELYRGDAISWTQALKNRFEIAGLTPNEVRIDDNREPLDKEGADDLYLGSGMMPLSKALQAPIASAPPPAVEGAK